MALYACQRAIRSYMMAKTWLWLQIWLAIKPTLKCTQFGKFKKEYEDKIAEAEANIDGAIAARAKAEKQRSDLAREIDQLGERLDEASGATAAQVELNKKREAEVNKLRKDVEEANIQQESVLSNLKRKQGDAIAEMTEQIDALGKMRVWI